MENKKSIQKNREVVIVSAVRTPIGKFSGSLKDIPVVQLGTQVIKETLQRIERRPTANKFTPYKPKLLRNKGLDDLEKQHYNWDESFEEIQVDEVIMGNVLQGGQGQNTTRQSMIFAGIPKEIPAFTVNKVCASGLKAITLAAATIQSGDADIIIAGGMENMTCTPYSLPYARWGYRMNINTRADLRDLMVYDGLWEIFYGYHMGVTAENIATKMNITRKEQDKMGFMSQERAQKALQTKEFDQEITPIMIPQRKGDPIQFNIDENPRKPDLEKMSKLPSVFQKDGTVTAANASGIADGAAAVLLMAQETAEIMGITPMATIRTYASAGVSPEYMGLGPVPAVNKILEKTNHNIQDIDIIELNEAFASQFIACQKELDLDIEKTNINGGSIAFGHPIGCTGARLVVSILHSQKKKNLRRGLVALCIGGGQGMAMLLERK